MIDVTLDKFVRVTNLAMESLGYMNGDCVEIFFTNSNDGVRYSISKFGIVSEEVKTGKIQYEGVEDFFDFLTYFKRTFESSLGDDLPLVYDKLLRVIGEGIRAKKRDSDRVSEFRDLGRHWE